MKRVLSFLIVMCLGNSCRKIVEPPEGTLRLKIENTTDHQIDLVLYGHQNGYIASTAFKVLADGSSVSVDETLEGGVERKKYTNGGIPLTVVRSDSALVSFDGKVQIWHFNDRVSRKEKSYNKETTHSLYNVGSFSLSFYKSQNGETEDMDFTYTFTEDDYLFAK